MSSERKVGVVTGGSQGIGAALVQAFRGRNYRVLAKSRSVQPSVDPDIVTVPGDVGEAATAERVAEEALLS